MKLAFAIAFLFLFSSAFAGSVDKVIVVSDATSADFMIAKAAGEKAGMPVLISEGGRITDDLKSQLKNLSVKTVVLIGGPAVINSDAEQQLSTEGYSAYRLWGMERTGTSLEVAKAFWKEGAQCAVLVEDAKDSESDTRIQEAASNIASQSNCTLIPFPRTDMPAEVLSAMAGLGIREIRLVTREKRADILEKLKQFAVRETRGSDDDIEAEVESEIHNSAGKKKLIIIAAPNWRHIFGSGGQPHERTAVRIVSSQNQTAKLIELIKARNFTEIKVAGFPALAQQIADQLNASGIVVDMVSGEKSHNVAYKLLEKASDRWKEKLKESKDTENRTKITERLLARVNETEKRINAYEVELDRLAAGGADQSMVAAINGSISAASSGLPEVRSKITAGDFDGAQRQLSAIINSIEKQRFVFRKELRLDISDDIENEEGRLERMQEKTDVRITEGKIAEFRRKCGNSTALQDLIDKAKSVRQQQTAEKEKGNYTGASELAGSGREIAGHARSISEICEKRGRISDNIERIARERAGKLREMEKAGRKEALTGYTVPGY